ncbi:hypothetical protein REPUB_Repub06bG0152400 [Reevesia pubescens]
MVLRSYPPTAKQLAVTIGFCLTGASLIAAGAYLSFVNVAPQQERATLKTDFGRCLTISHHR